MRLSQTVFYCMFHDWNRSIAAYGKLLTESRGIAIVRRFREYPDCSVS